VKARRPKVCKLAARPVVGDIVTEDLTRPWSPQQIAGWSKTTSRNDAEMQVSHETIYCTLFIHLRGALRKELTSVPGRGDDPMTAGWPRPSHRSCYAR
jgi:IS30 family transposase